MIKKITLFLLLIGFIAPGITAYASETTTFTYTISVEGGLSWIRTQDAYLPTAVFFQATEINGRGLNRPEDMHIRDGIIYIADAGNGRIVVYEPMTGRMDSFGYGVLRQPTGVFVTENHHVFVADYGLQAVYEFDADWNVVMSIYRPTTHLFSERSIYLPRKVAVTRNNTIFVVGEGSFEGLIMFGPQGDFLGYFGANPREMTAMERLTEIIFTEAQLNRSMTRVPRTITNIALDNRDLIYTVSFSPLRFGTFTNPAHNSIRRLNMAGENIFITRFRIIDEENFNSIAVNRHNCIIAITPDGVITQYDPRGEVMFSFGGRAITSERAGFLSSPVAVAVDENDFIYVLDRERNIVQVYFPTEFAHATHRALTAFEVGDYAGSLELWEDLLLLNGMSRLARNGYGMSLFALGRFDEARAEFAFTFNRMDYSEVYWEIRNIWITNYITSAMTWLIIIIFVLYIASIWNKKTKIITKFFARLKPKSEKRNLFTEILYAKNMLKNPIDTIYNLKIGLRGSVAAASSLYIITFLVYAAFSLLSAFLFRLYNNIHTVNPLFIVTSFFLPCALWIVSNYLVSSINDGEGSFKNVYICTAYSFAPFIVIVPFLVVMSYGFTLNEGFIIYLAFGFAVAWTAVNFYLTIQELHNFNFRNSMLNILLTLLAILIAIVGFLIVYLMASQAFGFIGDLYREVLFRVT